MIHNDAARELEALRVLRVELERQVREARERAQTERLRADRAEESAKRAWSLAWTPARRMDEC